MGWTFTHKEVGTSIKSFFETQMNYSDLNGSGKLLDCKVVNKTAYIAYQRIVEGKTEVFAFIYLLDYQPKQHFNFGYKDMDETMHPYYYDAPKSILDRLTPTDNDNANKWREECLKLIGKKAVTKALKAGDKIKFTNAFRFGRYGMDDTFEVVDLKKGHFNALTLNMFVKLRKSNMTSENNPWSIL